YKTVAHVETEAQLRDVSSELKDRYGDPPVAVRHLLQYAALKLLAIRVGVMTIERKRDLVSIKFRPNASIDAEKLARFVASQRGAQFTPDGTLKFALKVMHTEGVMTILQDLLQELGVMPTTAPAA